MKILHLISGLDDGGAESVLFNLCINDDNEHFVISMTDFGKYGFQLKKHGVYIDNLNLNFLKKLKKFGYDVGYSDHSLSVITPSIAVALGCKVIEKHFTLSKNLKGPDHKASLEPKEFFEMVKNIRIAEVSLGSNEKKISKRKKKNIKIAKK